MLELTARFGEHRQILVGTRVFGGLCGVGQFCRAESFVGSDALELVLLVVLGSHCGARLMEINRLRRGKALTGRSFVVSSGELTSLLSSTQNRSCLLFSRLDLHRGLGDQPLVALQSGSLRRASL